TRGEVARMNLSAVRPRSKIPHTQLASWRGQSKNLACRSPILRRNFTFRPKIDIVPRDFSPDWKHQSLRFIRAAEVMKKTGRCKTGLSSEIVSFGISPAHS